MKGTIHFQFRDHRQCWTEQSSLLEFIMRCLNIWLCDHLWKTGAGEEACGKKFSLKEWASSTVSMHSAGNSSLAYSPGNPMKKSLPPCAFDKTLTPTLSDRGNNCEESVWYWGDIDGRTQEFDSRLWSCLKQWPAVRTRTVTVHCGVKLVSMNLTAV